MHVSDLCCRTDSVTPRQSVVFVFPVLWVRKERNEATRLFARYLSAKSRELKSFHVISIFDRLVDPTLKTREQFYADDIHLNTLGLDLVADEFRRVVHE